MMSRLSLIAFAAVALSAAGAKAQGYGEPRYYDEAPREYERPHHHGFPPELHGIHAACERGDREACVRFGWLMHEHRDRHEAWRRERPDYFWWDRR